MPSHPRSAWVRLGELLVRRRVELDPRYSNRRIFTDERIPGKYRIINTLERGQRDTYEAGTIAAIEAAYRLAPGAIARFLAGGELEVQGTPYLAAGDDGVPMSAARRAETRPHKEAIRDLIAAAILATGNPLPRGADIFPDEHEQKRWDMLAELFRDSPPDGKLERIAGFMAEGRQQDQEGRAAGQGRAAGLIAVR